MIRVAVLPDRSLPLVLRGVLCALALLAVAVLVNRLGVPLVLAGITASVAMAALFLRPELATLAVVFLIYINAPAVAILHGVPTPVAGAVFALLGIPVLHRLLVRREPARWDRTLALMVVFLFVLLLASLGAPDKNIALGRVFTYTTEGVLLYWLIINVVTTRTALRSVTWSLLAAGTFLAALSIYQTVTRSYEQQFGGFAERKLQFEYKRELDLAAGASGDGLYRADRAEGPQVGNNRYAQIMLVLLPLAVLRLRRSHRLRSRYYAVAAGGMILVGGIALTYSRGGLLALIVVTCAAVLVNWIRLRHLLMAGFAAALLVPIASPNVFNRVSTLTELTNLSDPSTDGALRGRATEMLAGLHAFADHPIVGVGPGQYEPYFALTYQQIPDIKFRDIQEGRRAHSLYLEMAAETGILGLITFLLIPFFLLRQLWRAHRRLATRDPELSDTAAALWLGMVGFLFSAMFLSHAFERYYWLLVALAGASLYIIRTHEAAAASRPAARAESVYSTC